MFRKVLVANRGEIAIRGFRAAYELGAATVAVFPVEDRNSEHRLKADEAYQIGEAGHPVRAYLSHEHVIAAARRAGVDDCHPGYGLPSATPTLATPADVETELNRIGHTLRPLDIVVVNKSDLQRARTAHTEIEQRLDQNRRAQRLGPELDARLPARHADDRGRGG